MGTTILIRRATLADASMLPAVELSSGLAFRNWPGLEWIADDKVQSAEQHVALIQQGLSLVAETPHVGIVGFLNAGFATDALHIWQMSVSSEQQGKGIGRALLAAAEEQGAGAGGALTLTTFRDVPWNEPFYRKRGFRTLGAGEINSRLSAILEAEVQAGLPAALRCAMRKGQ